MSLDRPKRRRPKTDAEILAALDEYEANATRVANEAHKEGDHKGFTLARMQKAHIQRQRARVLEIIASRQPAG